MFRKWSVVAAGTIAALLVAGAAHAQESGAGAGTIEVSAVPVGGMLFMKSTNGTEPKFGSYNLGASVTGNVNKYVGFEGDVGFGIGMRRDLTFQGVPFSNQKTPNMWNYSGNVIVSPGGSDRAVVGYLAGGVGGLTLLN